MKREILRKKGDRWCKLEIELRDGRLSVCGSEGRIIKRPRAKKEALEYWRGFFEDQPEQLRDMNERCGTRFRSAASAARYVLDSDGDLHGLDVSHEEGDQVFALESCGQIQAEIAEWFPEARPLLPWHLNDMKPGCVHQDALGWSTEKMSTPCPTCGYKWGTAWLKRELPPEIVKLAETVGQ